MSADTQAWDEDEMRVGRIGTNLSLSTCQNLLPKLTHTAFSKRNSAINFSLPYLYWLVEENKIHSG